MLPLRSEIIITNKDSQRESDKFDQRQQIKRATAIKTDQIDKKMVIKSLIIH